MLVVLACPFKRKKHSSLFPDHYMPVYNFCSIFSANLDMCLMDFMRSKGLAKAE